MSTMEEQKLCLATEGFPSEVQALQVAEYIYQAYGVAVRKVAPININSCLGQKRWIICLYSPGDQTNCLSQKNAPFFTSNGIDYFIQLQSADNDCLPDEDCWTFLRSARHSLDTKPLQSRPNTTGSVSSVPGAPTHFQERQERPVQASCDSYSSNKMLGNAGLGNSSRSPRSNNYDFRTKQSQPFQKPQNEPNTPINRYSVDRSSKDQSHRSNDVKHEQFLRPRSNQIRDTSEEFSRHTPQSQYQDAQTRAQNPDVKARAPQYPDIQKRNPQNPDVQKRNPQYPNVQKRNQQYPDVQKSNPQYPDVQKRGPQYSDVQKRNPQNPDVQKRNTQNPDVQKRNTQNPDVQKRNTQYPDVQATYNANQQDRTNIQLSAGEIIETKNLKMSELRLLRAVLFKRDAEKRHRGLNVELRPKNCTITFKGMMNDVKDELKEVENILKNVKSRAIPGMSLPQRKVLEGKGVYQYIINKFKTKHCIVVWENDQVVTVYSFSDDDLQKGVAIIQESIVQRLISLPLESSHLLQTQGWCDLRKSQEDKHSDKLIIAPDQSSQTITIAATDEIIDDVTASIQYFIEENTIYSEVYCFSPSRQRFITFYWKDRIITIADLLKSYKVQLSIANDGKEICVKGTAKGLDLCKQQLQLLKQKIVYHVEPLIDQNKVKFLTSENFTRDLDTLGISNQCVLGKDEETDDIQTVVSRSDGSSATQAAGDTRSQLTYDRGFEFNVAGMRLLIKEGDILHENVDAIVNSSNCDLDLNRGYVSTALKRTCGPVLEQECKLKVADMMQSGIAVTNAYNLKCGKIIHIDIAKFNYKIDACIRAALWESEKLEHCRVAIPALGAGNLKRTPAQSANDVYIGLTRFCSGRKPLLQELHVVLIDSETVKSFTDTFRQLVETNTNPSCGITGTPLTSQQRQPLTINQNVAITKIPTKEVKLYIYAVSQTTVQRVLQEFDKLVADKYTKKQIKEQAVCFMSTSQVQKIGKIGKQHDVLVDINQVLGTIVLEGTRSNILDAFEKINNVVMKAAAEQGKKDAATTLENVVKWCFLEVTATGPVRRYYGLLQNHDIEAAFQASKKSVEFYDARGILTVIDFESMTGYPKDNNTYTVDVIRTDAIQASDSSALPPHWAIQGQHEPMKRVLLQPNDSEYTTIVTNLQKTLKRQIYIIRVERLQNPLLYRQYQAKKAHMEKQNPRIPNERTLWHGTAVSAVENINLNGFNRSYCGKNATSYGQGVYFAVNSSYSENPIYSPPDQSGYRYMYQCKVLVGYSTVGHSNLRFLPPRQGAVLFDSATDNMSKPALFVIFNDTQAYPEYLITFY